jgi:hypothetical protein
MSIAALNYSKCSKQMRALDISMNVSNVSTKFHVY